MKKLPLLFCASVLLASPVNREFMLTPSETAEGVKRLQEIRDLQKSLRDKIESLNRWEDDLSEAYGKNWTERTGYERAFFDYDFTKVHIVQGVETPCKRENRCWYYEYGIPVYEDGSTLYSHWSDGPIWRIN